MVVTGEDLKQALRGLGLSRRAVCLHSSLRSFGHVAGGAKTVIRAFLDEECTVLVPTFSSGFEIDRDMGAIPATLVRWPNRVRGNHPLDSFTAVGPSATELIAQQDPLDV